MYWNGYCLYALMCFTTALPHLNKGAGSCSYFKSEDVNKKSLVIDVMKLEMNPKECLTHGPFNTILIHALGSKTENTPISFSVESIEYEHLIVLNNAMPVNFCPLCGKGTMIATSLTVFKNDNLQTWSWLECTKFKYIRIDSCGFQRFQNQETNNLILSENLLTLTLVNIDNFDPWNDLNYLNAPNLRELSISYFQFIFLETKRTAVFPRLKRLNLRNNRIMDMEKDFFQFMPQLDEINLEGNLLKNIDLTFELKPGKLILDDNPLEGDEETCNFLETASFVDYPRKSQICQKNKD
ncbi:uncharacterized protein LOC141850740 [Brevipalpus obovatus]|uniref:uncharacterized protein LOC141850740 n=1 Tax=Brevipalpus obovatus TaxID=246614 RepID=UPI003D9FA1B7